MKAVVLEIRDGICAVMKEDGTVVKIKKQCEVGDVIELTEKAGIVPFPKTSSFRRIQAIVAVLVAAFVILGGTFHYTSTVKACAFVSMDVNPSLEYVLNAKDCVLSVRAWNEDAEPIVDFLNGEGKVKGKLIDEAVSDTTRYLRELGYLGKEEKEDNILVSVSTNDKNTSDRLASAVITAIETIEEKPVRVEVKEATLEEHSQAEQYGISTGRYVKAVEGKVKEASVSENTGKTEENGTVLTPQDLEKAKSEPVEILIAQDKKEPEVQGQKEEPIPVVDRPNPAVSEEKNKEDKKEEKKDKKDKDKNEETTEPSTETEEKSTEPVNTEPTDQTEAAPAETQEGTTEAAPSSEPSTETSIEAGTTEEPSTESPEPDTMTEEERAAAEAEAVRRQQEEEAAAAEAEAEAVRQQQEIEAAEAEAEAEAVRQQQEQEAIEGVAPVPPTTGIAVPAED